MAHAFNVPARHADKSTIKLQRGLTNICIISSPGQSPGRAIVLPPALAAVSTLAKC